MRSRQHHSLPTFSLFLNSCFLRVYTRGSSSQDDRGVQNSRELNTSFSYTYYYYYYYHYFHFLVERKVLHLHWNLPPTFDSVSRSFFPFLRLNEMNDFENFIPLVARHFARTMKFPPLFETIWLTSQAGKIWLIIIQAEREREKKKKKNKSPILRAIKILRSRTNFGDRLNVCRPVYTLPDEN